MHDLLREAAELGPTISWAKKEYDEKRLSDFDFVGLYILLYLGSRRPGAWCSGRLRCPVVPTQQLAIATSIHIADVPCLLEKLGGVDYLCKRIGQGNSSSSSASSSGGGSRSNRKLAELESDLELESCGAAVTAAASPPPPPPPPPASTDIISDLTVVQVFNLLKLSGIKKNGEDFANKCIVLWACGRCPLQLLFYIPTPQVVLRQQARGQRVVTVFTTEQELAATHTSNLTYMTGDLKHSRCPFEFTLHDLTHMEKFGLDDNTYHEQVGFFQCMSSLKPIRAFFAQRCGFDEAFLAELEYVISDMNCFSTHLLQYLFAKMVLATERLAAGTAGAAGAAGAASGSSSSSTAVDPVTTASAIETESEAATACISAEGTRELLEQRWRWLLQAFGMLATDNLDADAYEYDVDNRHSERTDHADADTGTGAQSKEDANILPTMTASATATATATAGSVLEKAGAPLEAAAAAAAARAAYDASMAMIDTAYRERGPMTAEQGDAIRCFFRLTAQQHSTDRALLIDIDTGR